MGGNCSIDAYIRTDQSNLGDIIEIPITTCGGITVSGQGNYDPANNRITFQLNYTTQNGSFQCTQTFY